MMGEEGEKKSEIVMDSGGLITDANVDANVDPILDPEGEDVLENESWAETELNSFAAAEVEDIESLSEDRILSILESLLFSTDKPLSMSHFKQVFKGTSVTPAQIRKALDQMSIQLAGAQRGVTLEEVNSAFQLRTKLDNISYLQQQVKAKPFKLSGPALEVMAIVAYQQPLTKAQIDEIRGVESGHLLRGLMEKNLVQFEGKSELPGKPMLYSSTRKFLEIFGLRNIRELPSLSEIDDLIPEGIGEWDQEDSEPKEAHLSDITGSWSKEVGTTYSEGEEELLKISDELETITTSSQFFEEEKNRQKIQKDKERAQNIKEALMMNEAVDPKDQKWLERYERNQLTSHQTTLEEEVEAAFNKHFEA